MVLVSKPSSRSSKQGWWRFAAAAALFAAFAAVFVICLGYQIGGTTVTIAVDDFGEAVAAMVAAAACAWAARRSGGRLRRAWGFIAAAAAAWCCGEIAWSVYEVGLGQAVPYPGLPDIGFIAAIPLTIAGVLTFGPAARGTATGPRLWLDRAIVALALLSSAWSLGLDVIVQSPADWWLEKVLNIAYPVGDIAIGTVLILALRRATEETQGRLFLLLGGLAANALADSAFSYLNATNSYGAIGSELDAGWVIGYLMIALAAFWPAARIPSGDEDKPIDVWQLALPWLAILVAAIALVSGLFRHHPIDVLSTVLIALIAVLLMVSQIAAHQESLSLLVASRRAAATLNDIIVHAPLGVVRVAPDLTVLQANPSFETMLKAPAGGLTGVPLARQLSGEALPKVKEQLERLTSGTAQVADFETEAARSDGSALWLHCTATLVRNATGLLEYYLLMVEDISARRAEEEVAAANLELLERLNRMKSQFLTKVSHEFRTALVGIQGFSELMREAETLDVDEVRSVADDIYQDAQRLNNSLNEMLELDAKQSRAVELRLEDTDVTELFAGVVREFQAATKNHRITTHLSSTARVQADPELLHQVMWSLLGRAVSYAPDGSPIDVSARNVDSEVRISVKDDGRATAQDLDAQLLGRGGEGTLDRVTALATGVGLPLARRIVQMHGGRLWFETGSGTVFTFALPLKAPVAARSAS